MCLVFLLGLILPGTLWAFWTWLTISFTMLGSFQLLSLQMFSWVLSLFSFWDPYNMNVDVFNVVPEVSYAVFIFFFHSFFCILFCSSDFRHSFFQVTHWFFCPLFCYWFLLVYYSSLSFSSSRYLVNISSIFFILFPRSWIICTIIILNSFSGRLPISTPFSCFPGVLFFHLGVLLYLFILVNILWLWFLFWRLWGCSSSCFFCLPSGRWSWWEGLAVGKTGPCSCGLGHAQ